MLNVLLETQYVFRICIEMSCLKKWFRLFLVLRFQVITLDRDNKSNTLVVNMISLAFTSLNIIKTTVTCIYNIVFCIIVATAVYIFK